jgi:hypothetical protein
MKLEDTQTETYKRVKAELLPGEDLLWVAPANPRRMSSGSSNPAIIFTIVGLLIMFVVGIAVFFIAAADTGNVSVTTITPAGVNEVSSEAIGIVIPIVVLTLILVFGVIAAIPVLKMRQAKNAVYAITDRRILMISGNSVQSYGEQDIQFVRRKMHRDGTGNILFRTDLHSGLNNQGMGVYTMGPGMRDVGFFGISNPREIEQLLLDTFRPENHTGKRKHDDELWQDEDQYFEDEYDNNQATR